MGQWLPAPCNGGPCVRAATRKPTRRGRLGPRTGIPKRTRPNCQTRYSQTSVVCINVLQRERDPKTLERAVKLSEGIVAHSMCKPTSYFLFFLFRFQFHLRPDVPDAYSGYCSLVLDRHDDTSVRQPSVTRTLKCPSRVPALWRIEDCSVPFARSGLYRSLRHLVFLCDQVRGSPRRAEVCNLWSLLRGNHSDFLLFWPILNFAGFRNFLMTASR